MRISNITEEAIVFDNGNTITFDHDQDCCEWNWADFSFITRDNVYYSFNFDPDNMQFEFIDEAGFRFGSCELEENGKTWYGDGVHWIFVPCYSDQNGYYTREIDIYYNKVKDDGTFESECVLHGTCIERN